MLYAIFARDNPGSLAARQRARPDHLARIAALRDAGRLVIAGPHPAIDAPEPGDAGYSGSLVVAEFESLAEAEQWAAADPYIAAGAWSATEVKPFIQVMP